MLLDAINVLQDIKDLETVAINAQKIAELVITEDVTHGVAIKALESLGIINAKNAQQIVINVTEMDALNILVSEDMEITCKDPENVLNVLKTVLSVGKIDALDVTINSL